jgi:hypothetical protein
VSDAAKDEPGGEDDMKEAALQAVSNAAKALDTVFDGQIAPESTSVRSVAA